MKFPHIRPVLTEAQRANLTKVADYLESLPENYKHFDMGLYFSGVDMDYLKTTEAVTHCGTVACALGHGPAAGIPIGDDFSVDNLLPDKENTYINWVDYSDKFVSQFMSVAWTWLFSDFWEEVDNHHWGAAARIRYLLENGCPVGDETFSFFTEEAVSLYESYRVDRRRPVVKDSPIPPGTPPSFSQHEPLEFEILIPAGES